MTIKKGNGRGIRQRGNAFERQLAIEFRELGFDKCVTARYESRSTDDKKVDLCFTKPFNVQAKCKNSYGNPIPVLREMPDDGNINVVLNKVVGSGEFATMTKRDFYWLVGLVVSSNFHTQ